jgi:hypothetical protein
MESSNEGGGDVCRILRPMADVEKPIRSRRSAFLAVGKRSFATPLNRIRGPAMRTLQTDFTSQHYFRNPAASLEKLRKSGPVIETGFPIETPEPTPCFRYQLARLEGKCALEALFERWPKLELAIQPADIKWRKRPGLRAIETLPVVARPQ